MHDPDFASLQKTLSFLRHEIFLYLVGSTVAILYFINLHDMFRPSLTLAFALALTINTGCWLDYMLRQIWTMFDHEEDVHDTSWMSGAGQQILLKTISRSRHRLRIYRILIACQFAILAQGFVFGLYFSSDAYFPTLERYSGGW